MMQEFVKDAFRSVFLKQMREKPFDKIRVKDIASQAGFSRKTFYNYYSDIYDLALDCYRVFVGANPDFRIGDCKNASELADCVIDGFRKRLEFCAVNAGYSKMMCEKGLWFRYLSNIRDMDTAVMSHSIEDIQPKGGPVASLFDVDFVARVYHICMWRIIEEWIEGGMKEPIDLVARRGAYLTFHLSDIFSADTGACAELKRFVLAGLDGSVHADAAASCGGESASS